MLDHLERIAHGIEFREEDADSGVRNAVGVLVILRARHPVWTHAIAKEHLADHKTALVPESRHLPGKLSLTGLLELRSRFGSYQFRMSSSVLSLPSGPMDQRSKSGLLGLNREPDR